MIFMCKWSFVLINVLLSPTSPAASACKRPSKHCLVTVQNTYFSKAQCVYQSSHGYLDTYPVYDIQWIHRVCCKGPVP